MEAGWGRLSSRSHHHLLPLSPHSGLLMQLFVVNPKSTADMIQDFTLLLPSLTPPHTHSLGLLNAAGFLLMPHTHVTSNDTPPKDSTQKENQQSEFARRDQRGQEIYPLHVYQSSCFFLSNLNLGTAYLELPSWIAWVRLGITGHQTEL